MATIKLWASNRAPRLYGSISESSSGTISDPDPPGWRSPFQQDYDRLLFSTPVRRLSDKTQVWPMDENDGIRTRLTHSHEVANLARSIGSRIYAERPDIFGYANLHSIIQPILSAIGLAHDLGNPPFGHQGEIAIGRWFKDREDWIFTKRRKDGDDLSIKVPDSLRSEFIAFDGNPQSFQLITKLQTHVDHVGLDLTAATLAASLKYPVKASNRDCTKPSRKKTGYFQSELKVVNWLREQIGLSEGQRHPLTWIMEACDDIAYSVLDVDDAMKKGIISPDDVLVILKQTKDLMKHKVVERTMAAFQKVDLLKRKAPIVRDVKIGYVRAYLIDALIQEAAARFIKGSDKIMSFENEMPLMDTSALCNALKAIARQYAFSNIGVLRMEAAGAAAINELMSFFWSAISDREDGDNLKSRRQTAKAQFGYSMISPNYVEDAVRSAKSDNSEGGVRYRELRLLTDMISGMTDTFAIKLSREIKEVPNCG